MKTVFTALFRFDNALGKIARWLTAIALLVQVTIVFFGVVFRYFLNNPLTWVDELSCFLLVFITFIGGYVALRELKLARLSFLVEMFPQTAKKILICIANLAILTLVAAISWYGIKLLGTPAILNQASPSMQLPMIIFYAFIPVSGIMMFVNMLLQTYDLLVNNNFKLEDEGGFFE